MTDLEKEARGAVHNILNQIARSKILNSDQKSIFAHHYSTALVDP